jgi:hypothetical protein
MTRVHPLEGGLAGWKALGFPVRELSASELTMLANIPIAEAPGHG